MPSGELVLITGANGHIGFRTVVEALKHGYSVRAALRNEKKANKVLSAPSIKAINPGSRLTFTFVPDLVKEGAYSEAVKDVDFIIHLASPITSGLTDEADFESEFIEPAVKGTTNILYSAFKQPSIKRVVITSSVVGILPWHDLFEAENDKVYDEKSRTPDTHGPFTLESAAYAASKVRALNATEKLLDQHKPHFSVVHVHPSFVIGKNELVTDAKDITIGTNAIMFQQVLGVKRPKPTPGASVHLHDVAFLHVKGLDPAIPDRQSLLASSGGIKGTVWGDAIDIVKLKFPDAVKDGTIPNNGESLTSIKSARFDTTETERLTGIQFKSYEEQVLSVTEHYLELIGQLSNTGD